MSVLEPPRLSDELLHPSSRRATADGKEHVGDENEIGLRWSVIHLILPSFASPSGKRPDYSVSNVLVPRTECLSGCT